MTFDSHGNFGKGTITVAPSPATSGTTISISNTDAANFPDPSVSNYNVVLTPNVILPDSTVSEIVRVTAKGAADSGGAGNTQFTIVRAQESSTAITAVVSGKMYLSPTAKTFTDIESKILDIPPTNRLSGISEVVAPNMSGVSVGDYEIASGLLLDIQSNAVFAIL